MTIQLNKLLPQTVIAQSDRRPADSTPVSDRGFMDKLDKALGSPALDSAPQNAKAVAEALTLQMLHSSLSISGIPVDTVGDVTTPFVTKASLQQMYDAVSREGGAQQNQSHELTQLKGVQIDEMKQPQQSRPTEVSGKSSAGWLDPVIAKASRTYGVDAALIKAVIKAESDFNPRAVSPVGARGLMQLMPATARSLGVSDSFDPEQNVMAGTRFLRDMLKRYGGDVDSALAAYNWGPGNVDRGTGRLPKETRVYLDKVKQLYGSYSA